MGIRKKDPSVKATQQRARSDARSDRRAGGFGLGDRHPPHQSEPPEAESRAYDRAYTRNAPRSWRKKR